jgi:hypothetical protein
MTTFVSDADAELLARPHVARAWFGVFDLPFGVLHVHSGVGRVVVGGKVYRGVTDPCGGRLVAVSQVDEPQFGQAASVTITLTGVNREFLKELKDSARDLEGRSANIYWAAFDAETQRLLTALIPVFPFGRLTSPAITWQGVGQRTVTLTVESIWQAKNFAPGGRWSPADQRRRYPGDLGLDFMGVNISENWP